ncbi:MAG: hypothetical protein H6R25_2177 [Proteobacteria bacterium]|nr:hypothetical protein [Pseudomonadota bacterium]
MSDITLTNRQPPRRLILLQGLVLVILCVWLCVILHIPLYNVGGGEGVWLPWNIVAWGMVVTVILLTVLLVPAGSPVITPVAVLLFLAVALLTLPLLWCPEPDWRVYSLPRLLGLWGGAFFYLTLLQCRFSDRQKHLFLWSVTFAAFIQGLTVLAGLFRPSLLSPLSQTFINAAGRSGLGIFQQINVTASFLSTGFALTLALFYRMHICHLCGSADSPVTRLLKSVYLLILLTLLPCSVILTQSRIGWLGGLMVYIVAIATVLITTRKKNRKPRWAFWRPVAMTVMPLVGIVAGIWLLPGSVAEAIDHSGSNHQRILTLKITWEMIRQHPWRGWGIGSFMMQFQHYMASRYHPNPTREFMGHPHNEILYIWMEGGIVALAGLAVMVCAVVILLIKKRGPARIIMAMAMLPVLLHTMVEFPLYLSVPHALILLLIALNLDHSVRGADSKVMTDITVPRAVEISLRSIIAVIAFWLLTVLHSTYRENALLSRYEAGEQPTLNTLRKTDISWLLTLRYETDRLNMVLDEYSRNGDLRLLRAYVAENARWLRTHTDPENYVTQVEVLHYLHRDEEACRYQHEGRAVFPLDRRFVDSKCQ